MMKQVIHADGNPLSINTTGVVSDVLDTADMGGADWGTLQAFAKSGSWTTSNAIWTMQCTNFDPSEESGWTALASTITLTGAGITAAFPMTAARYYRAITTTAAATETAKVYLALTAYKEFPNG